MRKLYTCLLICVPFVCYGNPVSETEAVAAVNDTVKRLGIADEFDAGKARASLQQAQKPSYMVETPELLAFCDANDKSVKQIVRIAKMLADRTSDGKPLSDDQLQRNAVDVIRTVGLLPAPFVVEKKESRGLVELGFFPVVNGYRSRFGPSVVTLDPYTGEFLSVAAMATDDIYETPDGLMSKSDLQTIARQAAENYVRTLPPETQENHLPIASEPKGYDISYGNTLKQLREGKEVRTLTYAATFGNVNVTLDAKSGKFLWGGLSRKMDAKATSALPSQSSEPIGPTVGQINESSRWKPSPNTTRNGGAHPALIIGGAMAAIIAAIALFLRKRA
jgi:hypothetical protein